MRGMSPAAKKRLGVGAGGFALGCGCKDAKAVAVAAASSASPFSTEASTATSGTWRRVARGAAAHPSASGSTGTLTVPSASSSSFPFPWEDAEEADGEEVNCGEGDSAAANPTSFSGLLRQLNELEQSVASFGPRKGTTKQSYLSPPPPPPPPPPVPSRRPVVKQRAVHSNGDRRDSEEGHGDFSPPPPPPSSHKSETQQQHRKAKSMDKGARQELAALLRQPSPPSPSPLQAEKVTNTKIIDKGSKPKEEVNSKSFPQQQQQKQPQQAAKHRKAKSFDAIKLDGTVAVVKQSADPLGDFRRSMVNMIVENRIVTGDELRELLRHFLALNAPHHHDTILRAFTEIWDEAFSTKQAPHAPHRELSSEARPTPPRQRAPTPPQQRRPRHATTRAWR